MSKSRAMQGSTFRNSFGYFLFVFQNSVAFADLPRTEKKICEVEEL